MRTKTDHKLSVSRRSYPSYGDLDHALSSKRKRQVNRPPAKLSRAAIPGTRVRKSPQRPSFHPYLSLAILIVLIFALGFLIDAGIHIGRIRPKVMVGDVEVGFKTKEKAAEAIDSALAKALGRKVDIRYEDKTWTLESDNLGLDYDNQALLDEAFKVGREGSIFKRFASRFGSYFFETKIDITPEFSELKTSKSVSKIRARTDVPAVQSSVRFNGDAYVAQGGSSGKLLNVSKLQKQVSAALLKSQKSIEAPVEIDPLNISEEEAKAAAEYANKLLIIEPKVSNGSESVLISKSLFSKILSFKSSKEENSNSLLAYPYKPKSAEGEYLQVALSIPALDEEVLDKINAQVSVEPVAAKFDIVDGKVVIVPEKAGQGHSASMLAKDLVANGEKTAQSFSLKEGEVWPELTVKRAQGYGIKEQLSTFTINFGKADPGSAVNIRKSAEYLDGYLIAPGDTFSFNDALGKRTFDRGFVEAPAIVGGKLVPDLGGGICLTSSTIFNTVLLSGMPVVDRINHSFKLPSYPDGQDAAVSWGAPDFKFKNESPHWLLLDSSLTDDAVSFSLYGTSSNYDVDIAVGEWKNVKEFPKERLTTDLVPAGETKIIQEGANGGNITVTRTVKQGDTVVRVDDFRSYYRPRPEITGIGR